jgi:hypothetical protein
MERQHHINFWYAILAITIMLLIQSYFMSEQHTETITYSRFEELLKAGAVKDIAISRDTLPARSKSRQRNVA